MDEALEKMERNIKGAMTSARSCAEVHSVNHTTTLRLQSRNETDAEAIGVESYEE